MMGGYQACDGASGVWVWEPSIGVGSRRSLSLYMSIVILEHTSGGSKAKRIPHNSGE